MQREGHQVARCTVEHLMRELGLAGVRRGRKIRTTVRADGHAWTGVVYIAFLVDIFSRAIVGWAASTTKRTRLVLDALDMAL